MKPGGVMCKGRFGNLPMTGCDAISLRSNPCRSCRRCETSETYPADSRTTLAGGSFDPRADRSPRRAICKFSLGYRNVYRCNAQTVPGAKLRLRTGYLTGELPTLVIVRYLVRRFVDF